MKKYIFEKGTYLWAAEIPFLETWTISLIMG